MIQNLKRDASRLLRERPGTYPQLIRFHSFLSIGAWFIFLTASYLIHFLAPEGGLSNLGTHSLLFTTQIIILAFGLLLMPVWEMGINYVTLDFIRNRRNIRKDLLEGFRCLRPLMGCMVYNCFQYALVYLISSSATGIVLTFLPFSQAFYSDALTLLENPSTPLKGRMLIVAAVYGIIFLLILLFLSSQVFYRYRMTHRIILDKEDLGGMKASIDSKTLLKGHKRQLFRLDLSYWWFHLADGLGIVLPISIILISGLDIAIPEIGKSILWGSSVISLLLRLIIHSFLKPKISATYALFYDHLINHEAEVSPKKEPTTEKPSNKRVPWQY